MSCCQVKYTFNNSYGELNYLCGPVIPVAVWWICIGEVIPIYKYVMVQFCGKLERVFVVYQYPVTMHSLNCTLNWVNCMSLHTLWM